MGEERFDLFFGWADGEHGSPVEGISAKNVDLETYLRHPGARVRYRPHGSDGPWTTIRAKKEKAS